nr:HAD family hydrolase [uncultured Prevotella sp.]
MEKLDHIKAIAFDADDTLWALQNYFEGVEDEYCDLLADYGSKEEISAALFETESGNMADLGYGVKAFIISLVENAIKVSEGKASARLIGRIVEVGKSLLHVDAKPLEGVEKTLAKLREMRHSNNSDSSEASDASIASIASIASKEGASDRKYRLAVFTKGELMDQENKLWRSGLQRYFDVVSIVSNKTPEAYRHLCKELEVSPEQLVMVGNSFKSDIAPALKIGASAIHIPFHTIWAHEKTEEFNHERLRRISHFEEILEIL